MPLKMLAPGMYERDGELHIDVAELGHDAETLDMEDAKDVAWLNENVERLLALAWAVVYPEAPLPEVEMVDGPPVWKGQG